MREFGLDTALGDVTLTEPLGYIDFLSLTSHARLILTDSGGLQEESTALGIPCLTLRENTERPITVTHGTNRIVGTRHGRHSRRLPPRAVASGASRPAGAVGRAHRRTHHHSAAPVSLALNILNVSRVSNWPVDHARLLECAVVAVVFCVGTYVGLHAVRTFRALGGGQYFYQTEFGPAVMLACGRGFDDPDVRSVPALDDFLEQRVDTFDCASLGTVTTKGGLNGFQRGMRYWRSSSR